MLDWQILCTVLSIGADVLQQIICTIKIRRAPARHDNMDFKPIITRISEILSLSVVAADKGYDSEDNHLLGRDGLHAFSIIPARYEHIPIWRTHGMYRKQMKRGYSKMLYNQRNKDETIMSVIKRLFGEHLMSRLTRTQNRELSLRCITYNMHRLTNLIIVMMFSTKPNLTLTLNTNLHFPFFRQNLMDYSSSSLPYVELIFFTKSSPNFDWCNTTTSLVGTLTITRTSLSYK
jgi:hypothetical protein